VREFVSRGKENVVDSFQTLRGDSTTNGIFRLSMIGPSNEQLRVGE
jgi:hypothetical protein